MNSSQRPTFLAHTTSQAAAPSPFYFFDEVDAALDSLNASRVAEYIARGGVLHDDYVLPLLPAHGLEGAAGAALAQGARAKGGAGSKVAGADSAAGGGGSAAAITSHAVAGGASEGSGGGGFGAAQYVVVSHRPQVYEQAGCLVGVYTREGSSQAVLAHFQPIMARSSKPHGKLQLGA